MTITTQNCLFKNRSYQDIKDDTIIFVRDGTMTEALRNDFDFLKSTLGIEDDLLILDYIFDRNKCLTFLGRLYKII